jgi:hypothetical protein
MEVIGVVLIAWASAGIGFFLCALLTASKEDGHQCCTTSVNDNEWGPAL